MAKNKENAVENTEAAVEGAAPAASRGKKVMITDVSTGETFARADWIKARFEELGKKDRSAIVKELAERFGHVVPYQIVFAATKEPKAKVEAAPAEQAA